MTCTIAKTACGCTDKTVIQTPWPIQNRPGLDAIAYRIGTQPAFFEALIARLTSHELDDGTRPLQRLTARNRDDFSIALLDAWAVMADVLTFYQERIANEGFLMTATERRSVLELARLVGYRLRPGVAASTYLAFTLDDGFEIELPEGVLARSLPGPDEMAEPFETAEPLFARTAWNAIPARLYRPQTLRPDVGFDEERKLYLDGTATNLATGQMILLRQGDAAQPYVVRTVTADSEAGRTTVCYADPKQPARLESSIDSEIDFEAKPVGHLASLGPWFVTCAKIRQCRRSLGWIFRAGARCPIGARQILPPRCWPHSNRKSARPCSTPMQMRLPMRDRPKLRSRQCA